MAEKAGVRGPSRFITWVLVATAACIAFLALCQRQKTLPELTGWDFHLRHARKVLVLSDRQDLLSTAVPGVVLVKRESDPVVSSLADGTDALAFAKALSDAGYGGVIVDPAADPGATVAPLAAEARLARFHGEPWFTALMLRRDAGLFSPIAPPDPGDAVLSFLVKAARKVLEGGTDSEVRAGAPAGASAASSGDYLEVAIQLQGLPPRDPGSKKARLVRQDVYVSGTGPTLVDAAIDAAHAMADRYGREAADGPPIAEAVRRLRIEISVMRSFALVDHAWEGSTPAAYDGFMSRVFRPGLDGVSANWIPVRRDRAILRSGYRFRLPGDAVYWGRSDARRMLERIVKDAHLGKVDALASDGNVVLDRLSTIDAIEIAPGGKVARLSVGRVVEPVAPGPESSALLAQVAQRLAAGMDQAGRLAPSYLPDRDMDWPAGGWAGGATYDQRTHCLGMTALYAAAARTGSPSLRAAADAALDQALPWVETCQDCRPVPVAALVLAAIADRIAGTPAGDRKDLAGRLDPIARGLLEFLISRQRPDGAFVLAAGDDPGSAGMALAAIARSAAMIEDDRIAPAVEAGLAAWEREATAAAAGGGFPAACDALAPKAAWMGMAAIAASNAGLGTDAARKAAIAGATLLVDRCFVPPEAAISPAIAGAYDGGAGRVPAASDLLAAVAPAAAKALQAVPPDRAAGMDAALAAAASLAGMLVVRAGRNDHFYPVPEKALGGVSRDLLRSEQGTESAFCAVAILSAVGGGG